MGMTRGIDSYVIAESSGWTPQGYSVETAVSLAEKVKFLPSPL